MIYASIGSHHQPFLKGIYLAIRAVTKFNQFLQPYGIISFSFSRLSAYSMHLMFQAPSEAVAQAKLVQEQVNDAGLNSI